MSQTLVQIITEFTDRRGLDRPSGVIGSSDQTIAQLRGLAQQGLSDITSRANWSGLSNQVDFVTVADGLQGSLDTLAPGFRYVIEDTMRNLTDGSLLYNDLTPGDWQASRSGVGAVPMNSFRIWNNSLYLPTNYPVGQTVSFEYVSNFAVKSATDVWSRRFAADDDLFMLDEELLLAYLNWAWRREKGLSYTQEKLDYEALFAQNHGQDGKPRLNMADGSSIGPGFTVPLGSWNL